MSFYVDEYMVEMENIKLDHEQEVLQLKTQLQQALGSTSKIFVVTIFSLFSILLI